LAKELGVSSKEVIEKCRAEGIELKNHMAAISAGLAESIREWFSSGEDLTSVEVAEKVDLAKVRKRTRAEAAPAEEAPATVEPAAPTAAESEEIVAAAIEPPPAPPAPVVADDEVTPPAEATGDAAAAVQEPAPAEPAPVDAGAPADETPGTPAREEVAPAAEAADSAEAPDTEAPAPEELAATHEEQPAAQEPPRPAEPVRPAGPQVVPTPAELKGPRVVRIEAPEQVRGPWSRPRPAPAEAAPAAEVGGATKRKKARGGADEKERTRSRSPRRKGTDVGERLREWRDQDLIERKERLAGATGQGIQARRAAERRRKAAQQAPSTAARKAPVELTAPIQIKDMCAATGIPFAVVSKKLMEHTGSLYTINQTLDAETLELIALDLGISVKVEKARTALEQLRYDYEQRERENLQPRPPVVAMLGHVDHGKTSLLDAIRHAKVAAGEAGGITQHIGAYRIDREGWRVTFLDTPGHEAFTAMRGRGANMTDVVVLVVAADDGVMPQTAEAINHAKAAGVQIVVALNKIDLPSTDINRVYAQLAERELTPAEWGGETDVIKTSATTGEGLDELIEHLSTLSDLLDLKADPTVPARGVVIEAKMREGQGVSTQVLVQEGTLRVGDIVVAGSGAGRIRSLRDDRGKSIKQAEPGWPVEVVGLDELPQAGDPLYVLEDLKTAKAVADETRDQRRAATLEQLRKPASLEDMLAAGDEAAVPELPLIVKADVQGSVDVLRKSLEEFPREKAQLKILHAAVGAISEADVHLARASDAIIVGFHVVPEDRARQLADELGVEVRVYRVIYEMLDDVHKALAGLLAPTLRDEKRGAAEVRQVFNVSRLGTIAGCYVTDGLIRRNHRVRLIRDGRIVHDRGRIQSLKRFKDDAREVRAGLECGIKLEHFDDIKPADVIEAYEIVEEAQEL
jgi:translation initiation factor IF-2